VVPEAGDEIQTMKSGIMEIADIFVVNKADREGADTLVHTLMQLTAHAQHNGWQIPVIKTAATLQLGINELTEAIQNHGTDQSINEKKVHLLTEKAYRLIRQERMRGVRKDKLFQDLEIAIRQPEFNLYRFILEYQTR
jgi:LAO/AO transport system kinase